ncbi:MAG: hypothetical protein ABSC91_01440 [Candidatus Bathyarchaeia archaeon]|jgi:hypothetical protein
MKLLRIGVILFVVGVSLLVATQLRAKSVMLQDGYVGGFQRALGPYLFEPRETIIVLQDSSPQNVTVAVVRTQAWLGTQEEGGSAAQNVSRVAPVFNVSGMMDLDRVTFKMPSRGVYYILVLTSAGKPVDSVDLAVEQEGVAEDLLTISAIILGVGVAIIIVDRVRPLRRHGH